MTSSEPPAAEKPPQPDRQLPISADISALPPAPPAPLTELGPVGPTRSLTVVTKVTSVLLGVATLAALAGSYAFFNRANAINSFNHLFGPTSDELARIGKADDLILVMNWIYLLAVLVTAIPFIVWQYQHAKNAVALGAQGLGPGWAIGGWFIPIANLILPVLQVRHAARASDPGPGRGAVPGSVTGWATAYIVASVVFVGGGGINPPDNGGNLSDPAAAFARADMFQGFGLVGYAIAGLFGIVMVRTLTQRQERAIRARAVPV